MNNSSILIQKFNPITGQLEWEMRNEDYDYTQEVARAGFADMLHDEERVNWIFSKFNKRMLKMLKFRILNTI